MKYRGISRAARAALIGVAVALATSVFSGATAHASDSVGSDSASPQVGVSGAAWNSCSTLTWKVRRPHVSRRTIAQVRTALRQLNAATGMNFIYGGHATRAELAHPADGTVIIGFSSSLSKKNYGGLTLLKKVPIGDTGAQRIMSARVTINRSLLSGKMAPYFMPVLLHELGHVVGLTHVDDSTDIMYPVIFKGASYEGGTLAKLSAVGAAATCTKN